MAAGFAPLSIGTETDGSLVQPATRAALYGMKATPGSVDTAGIQPISPAFDSVGGLAKNPTDLANLMGILLRRMDYTSYLGGSWTGLRVGFVDPNLWQPADFVVEPNEGFREQTVRKVSHPEQVCANCKPVHCHARSGDEDSRGWGEGRNGSDTDNNGRDPSWRWRGYR